MDNRIHVALDVHVERTAVAVLRAGQIEPDHRVIPSTALAYRKLVSDLGGEDIVVCYEAGPCGFEPYRIFARLGVPCDVIAPSLIPRRPGDHVKTDRLDARNLARLHRAGQLTAIRVPTPEEEALRDLVRTREQIKTDRRRSIQRLRAFLLRHGHRYPGQAKGWSSTQQAWANRVRLEDAMAQLVLEHHRAAVATRDTQLSALTAEVERAADLPQIRDAVAVLRALRGIDTLSAVTIVVEVGDFRQFAAAPAFMGYTGLVPREHSSGERERRGSITKAGNAHVRRVLVEAAWHYQHKPAVGLKLSRRQVGLAPEAVAHAWAAQQRLHRKFWKLARAKGSNVAVVAVARELAGFIWGLMNERYAS